MNKETSKFSELEKAIIRTVAFFDIFDYPLTILEIYKWFYLTINPQQFPPEADQFLAETINKKRETNLSEILVGLEELKKKKVIDSKNGFYFFPGRENLVNLRQGRYLLAEVKFKIARRAIKFLRFIPFIRMIAVCNNAAYSNAAAKSDIDFFIVVAQGRIWWTRLLITLLLTVLGLRRHGQKITDRICLSFYLTDDSLNLSSIALKPIDPYFIYWLATLAPIYQAENYPAFLRQNLWLKDYLPNFYPVSLADRRQLKNQGFLKICKQIGEFIFSGWLGKGLENFAKAIQLLKMKKNKKSLANKPDSRVVISDIMLKFHETDQRQIFYQAWQEKLNLLGINV